MDRNSNPPQKDESIIDRARRGDQDAMRRLYDETKSYAWFIAKRYLHSDADVEDILQEVYVAVFMKLDTFDGGHFKAWVHKIVTNMCLDFLRKQRLVLVPEDEVGDLADGNEETIPSEWLDRAEKRRDIIRIIDALPPGQRMAVTMFYLEGLPVAEIAEVMGTTTGTVKNHLYHGRQAIKANVLLEKKKGNKLYSLVPVPLLTQLFELEAEAAVMPEAVSEAVWNGTMSSLKASGVLSGSATGATGRIGREAKKTGNLKMRFSSLPGGTKALIITGIIVAALAVLGIPAYLIATGVQLVPAGDRTPSPPSQQSEATPLDTQDADPPTTDVPSTSAPASTAPATAVPSTTAPVTETPAATIPDPTTSVTPSPTPASTATPMPQPTEISYAYIADWREGSSPLKEFRFMFLDWLTGDEAVTKYMQDNGCSREEAEEETQEAGYVRTTDRPSRWYAATDDTVYYIRNDATYVDSVKVNYETFLNRMIPAIEAHDYDLIFVKLTVSGEDIVRIEWVYHP